MRPLLSVGQPSLPAVLPLAGDGSFVSPFHLDLSETLAVAVLSLLGPDFLDMAIGLNNQLRALAGPTLAVGLVNASTGRKRASRRGDGGSGRDGSSGGGGSSGKGLGVCDADTRLALLREESSSAGMIIGIGIGSGAGAGASSSGQGDGSSGGGGAPGQSSSFRVIDATGRLNQGALVAGRGMGGPDGSYSPMSLGTGTGSGSAGGMGGLASPLSDSLLYGDGGSAGMDGGLGGDYLSHGDVEVGAGGASPGLSRSGVGGKVRLQGQLNQPQASPFKCSGSAANIGRPVQRQRALRRVFEFVAVLNDTLQARSEAASAALAALQTVRAEAAARRAARDAAAAARAAEAAQVQWASAPVVSPGGVRGSLPGSAAPSTGAGAGSGTSNTGSGGAGADGSGAAGGNGASADASGGAGAGAGSGGMERSHSSASDAVSAHSYWTSDAEAAMMAAAAEDAADAQAVAEAEAALREALRWVPFGFGQPGGEVTLYLGVLGGNNHGRQHHSHQSSSGSGSSGSAGYGQVSSTKVAAIHAAEAAAAAPVPPRPCLLVMPRGCPPPDADGRFPFPLPYGAIAVRPVSRSAFEILTAALSRTRAGAAAAAATAAAAAAAAGAGAVAGATPGSSGGSVIGGSTGSEMGGQQRMAGSGSGGSSRALSVGGSSSPYLGTGMGGPLGYGAGPMPGQGHSRPASLTGMGRRGSLTGPGLGPHGSGAGSVVSGGSGGKRKAGSDSGADGGPGASSSGGLTRCCSRFGTLLCLGATRAWTMLPTLRNAPASGSAAINSAALLLLLVANTCLTLLCLAGYAQLARPFLWPLLLIPPGGLPAAALLGHVAAGLHSARLHRAHAALEVLALLPVLLAACFGAGLAAKGTFDWPLGVAVPAVLALVKLMLLRLGSARVALLDLQQELDAHATGPVAYVRELFAAQAVAVAAAAAAGGVSGSAVAPHALVAAGVAGGAGGALAAQGHGDLRSFLPNAGAGAPGMQGSISDRSPAPAPSQAAGAGVDGAGSPMMTGLGLGFGGAAGGELDATTGAVVGSYGHAASSATGPGSARGGVGAGLGGASAGMGASSFTRGPGPGGRGMPMSDLSFAMHGAPLVGLGSELAGAPGGAVPVKSAPTRWGQSLNGPGPEDMLSMGNEW